MLIVEGADLVGKTTLCKELVKRLNELQHPHIYRHLSRLPNSFHRYYGYQSMAAIHSVQDRFHMSEPVYAAMRGDETPLTPWLYDQVDAMLLLKSAFTVVVYAINEDLIRSRWGRDEMYDLESVLAVNASFDRIANHGTWQGYNMRVDFRASCSQQNPYPDPEPILHAYLKHLDRFYTLRNEEALLWKR